MKGKKKEEFDYQSFEEQALKAMYEGKSLEQAQGPLLKRLVEAGLQGGRIIWKRRRWRDPKIVATARRANRYAATLGERTQK